LIVVRRHIFLKTIRYNKIMWKGGHKQGIEDIPQLVIPSHPNILKSGCLGCISKGYEEARNEGQRGTKQKARF
jgi:hypothetical protein